MDLGLDETYIRRCLELARMGQGKTHPNPMVGCVVLDEQGQVAGEGYHPYIGGPHAEVMALGQAGERARGGTLYVSLEPCNHFGKTPPCSQAVLASGVKTVICGMTDPNPKVAGAGIQTLRQHGIEVKVGVLEQECRQLNEAFCHFIQTRRPFVVIKQAMTLDGKIATRSGESRWITGTASRKWVHRLRAESDAILTTAETAIKDNSRLSVREVPLLENPPIRVVLDRDLRLNPAESALFEPDSQGGPVWVFTRFGNAKTDKANRIEAMGARVVEVGLDTSGLSLVDILDYLGEQRITQLMVEAGGRLTGALVEQNLVNKLWLLYGGRMIPDPAAKLGFWGSPIHRLSDAPSFRIQSHLLLEDTLLMEVYPDS